MKNARVSELKAHLSAYLAKVRKGETVIVCDRSTPIARLVPYESDPPGLTILAPSQPRSELLKVKAVRPKRPIDIVEVLREDRDQR
jgi:prevent-host-death family protein